MIPLRDTADTLNFSFSKMLTESTASVKNDSARDNVIYIDWKEIRTYNGEVEFINSLEEIIEECSESNWDGYGAEKINLKSLEYAIYFMIKLPFGIGVPEVCPEPNGNIGLEWKNESCHLTLSIDKDGKLYYTAIIPDDIEMKVYDFKKSGIRADLEKLLLCF